MLAMVVTAGGAGVRVARLTDGTGVTAKSVCGALQENKIKGTVKTNRQSLKVVLIYAYPTGSYRSDTVVLIIRPNMRYQLQTGLLGQ